MLLLRIIGRPYAYSVIQTDELPRPIILESDDQRLIIPWFSPLYALPFRSDDELGTPSQSNVLDLDDRPPGLLWSSPVYALPFRSDDELSLLSNFLADDYSYFAGGIQPVSFLPQLYQTDEISPPATAAIDDDLTWNQIPYQAFLFRQPVGTTDELSIPTSAVIDEEFAWNQAPWAAVSFRQPASDTDEVSVPILLEDDIAWVPPAWAALAFAQPVRDTDEVSTVVVTIVEDDVWGLPRWQTSYFAQPPIDTDEVSVPRILDDEFWFQGFSKYLGDRVFAQPYGDGVSFHFIPPVISGNPASLLLNMSMMRLGGRAF